MSGKSKAELAAYQRGYRAGRRAAREASAAEERQAFRRAAFLAALPQCIAAQGWKVGEEPIRTLAQRVDLAVSFADEAVRKVLG